MRRFLVLALALSGGALGAPAEAQETRAGMAVLPFDNGGSYGQDREVFDALRYGIAATLAAELGRSSSVQVVDRARTLAAARERGLGANGRVDAGSAARVGAAVGARYMVMGMFIDFYGKFVLNARIVDVESGAIVKVVSSDQKDRGELFAMIAAAAREIITGIDAAAPAASTARAVPTEALTHYSLGLLHEDRGERARAAESYQQALALLPDYAEARDGLRRVRPT